LRERKKKRTIEREGERAEEKMEKRRRENGEREKTISNEYYMLN